MNTYYAYFKENEREKVMLIETTNKRQAIIKAEKTLGYGVRVVVKSSIFNCRY